MLKKYFICIFLVFVASCSNATKNREMCGQLTKHIKEKKYEEALKTTKNKNFYAENNSVLLKNLEIGTVHYMKGDYYQALQYFNKSKKISDDLYTVSIRKKIASGWDANLDEYYGERYERSMIRFYLSIINYDLYRTGVYEEYIPDDDKKITIPRKELTKSERQEHLMAARSNIIEWDSLLRSYKNETPGEAIYKDDMLAKIWGAFIHSECNNNNDKQIALQLYNDANDVLLRYYNMYPTFNNKYQDFNNNFKKLPELSYAELQKRYIDDTEYAKNLKEFIARNKKILQNNKKDNVVVVIKDNLISPKSVKTYEIPFPITSFGAQGSDLYEFARLAMTTKEGMPYIVIEFPEIKRVDKINKYTMVIKDRDDNEIAKTDLTLLQPLSDVAKKTLDDKAAAIKSAIIARITAKYVAAIASSYALYSQGDTLSMIAALAMFKSASIAINNTSKADIRYWATLFSDMQMGGVRLENGEYKLTLLADGKELLNQDISLQKGQTVFLDLNF